MASESDFVRALQALGPGPQSRDFVIDQDGVTVRVLYVPGSSSHLSLSTRYVGRAMDASDDYRGLEPALVAVRPMEIRLRAERSGDRAAKADGVAVEAQTGDRDFDEAIYVDTPSEHAVVRAVLGAPALRDAVRALVEAKVAFIVIDDGGQITLRVDHFSRLPDDPRWLLRHFAQIALHVPEVRASGGRHPVDPWQSVVHGTGAAAIVGMVIAPITVFSVLPERCYDSDDEGSSLACSEHGCCTPVLGGTVLGGLVGLFAVASIWNRVRGSSRAHTQRSAIAVFLFLLGLEVCLIGAHVLGALLLS